MTGTRPMQVFLAGWLCAAVMEGKKHAMVIREIRNVTATDFEVVFGSGLVVRVQVQLRADDDIPKEKT